ncbi:MAG: PDZ domain-containing protein, partial [Planctomycetes bacterium]|nr:PDZ domain-containing protein [Planctomycetota bacterium]
VMAMGAPFGFSRSVSLGIVSNARRYLEASPYNLWIQTDAAINPGNSGGPLIDVRGEVVGINARGVTSGENLGFAIPSARVREVIEEIQKKGRVERAWTGLSLQALRDFSRDVIIDRDEGVLIASVDRNSPASDAGLRIGDRIVAIDGDPVQGVYVEDLPAVERRLAALPAGRPAIFRIERAGAIVEVSLAPDRKGQVEGGDLELAEWDMAVKEINRYANRFQAYFVGKGVFIQGVKPRGNARRSGLRAGDIVLEIGGEPVRSLDDARTLYAKFNALPKGQRKVLCAVLRDGYRIAIALDFNRESEERAATRRERF